MSVGTNLNTPEHGRSQQYIPPHLVTAPKDYFLLDLVLLDFGVGLGSHCTCWWKDDDNGLWYPRLGSRWNGNPRQPKGMPVSSRGAWPVWNMVDPHFHSGALYTFAMECPDHLRYIRDFLESDPITRA